MLNRVWKKFTFLILVLSTIMYHIHHVHNANLQTDSDAPLSNIDAVHLIDVKARPLHLAHDLNIKVLTQRTTRLGLGARPKRDLLRTQHIQHTKSTKMDDTLKNDPTCPTIENISAFHIKDKIKSTNEIHNKPWSKSNKYLIMWNDKRFVLKTDNANFEIVYHLISNVFHLKHSKYKVLFTTIRNKNIVLNPWHTNIEHGWKTYPFCTNVSNIYAFHVLYNDFLMGYSDRAPNCHVQKGTVIPIDQDSGSYTAKLLPQQDKVYEKHILHNLMLKQDRDTCVAFKKYLPCDNYTSYRPFEKCIRKIFTMFPLHSTKFDHVLYRYNESKLFSCICIHL